MNGGGVRHLENWLKGGGRKSLLRKGRDCLWWWWWIVFVVWLTDERHLALFPAGTTVRDPHHHESPTRRKQGLNWAEPEFRHCWMKLCSSDNHYTTTPNRRSIYCGLNVEASKNLDDLAQFTLDYLKNRIMLY